MIRRWLPVFLLGIVFAGAMFVAAQPDTDRATSRAERLAMELRCPECRGQSVAESEASSARAAFTYIEERVAAGATDAQIKADLESRFGASILLRPPARGVSGLVWVVPIVVGVAALAGLAVLVQRWRSRPLFDATDADAVLVAKARRR